MIMKTCLCCRMA